MDTSPSEIARIENVRHPLDARTLSRLTDALGPLGAPADWDVRAGTEAGRDRARRGRSDRAGLLLMAGLATAIVAAGWLSLVVVDESWAMAGLAAASVAALSLSVILAKRGATTRVRAEVVLALWLSVIGVGVVSSTDEFGAGGDELEALNAEPPAPDGAVLGLVASGDQSATGVGTPVVAGIPLSEQAGRCASLQSEGGKRVVLTVGILPSPWTNSLVIYYPSMACGATLAEMRNGSLGHGVFVGSQGKSSGSYEGGSIGGGGQGSSPGSAGTVGDALNNPLGGAGNAVKKPVNNVGNTVNNVGGSTGNTVNNVGNTVNNVGNAVKKPVSGVGNTVNNVGNNVGNAVKKPVSGVGNTVNNVGGTVGNTVNNVGGTVGNTVKKPVSGVGGVLKGLGGP